MSTGMILLVVLVIIALGGLPTWGYHERGYGPSGLVGIILIIVLILVLAGRI